MDNLEENRRCKETNIGEAKEITEDRSMYNKMSSNPQKNQGLINQKYFYLKLDIK